MKNSVPEPPADLTKPQQALWREILDQFEVSDAASLRVLHVGLQALDRAESARRRIKKDGQVVTDRFGQPKAHPLLSVERDARSQFMLAIQRLQLDIAAPPLVRRQEGY